MTKKILIFFLCLYFSACNRPYYTPQYVNIPDSWRFEANECSTLCNLRWWEQFNDPVLNAYIHTALIHNMDIQTAIFRVIEYYNRLAKINADLYPEIDLLGSYQRFQSSLVAPSFSNFLGSPTNTQPGFKRINNDFQLLLNLNWELDFWGRFASESDAAYAELLAQVESRRSVILTIVSSVAEGYIILRGLDAQLEVSKKTLISREESLKLAKERFNLGETSELEVKQSEAEVEDAILSVLQLERDIPIQENLLSILLGQNPRDLERGLKLSDFGYPINIPAGLPSELLYQRPDIMKAEYDLIAANARVFEARALFFPRFTLTGTYGSDSADFKNFLTAPSELWSYGFDVAQVIFDAGRLYFNHKQAQAIRNELLYTYRQTILTAFKEVNDALISYKMNRELVLEHQKQVEILKEYLHLAQLRYQEGEVDYLNVLDAERRLFSSQLSEVQAEIDNFRAVVFLYKALGGGWVCDAETTALNH